MKIPNKLKIGGHIISIDISKELSDADGEFSTKDNKISICKALPQSQREVTLFHEIFHALNACFDEGMNHLLLESISQQFYQVLSDNKMLR